MLNLLLGNTKLYIAFGVALLLAGYFYLRLDSTKNALEKTKSELHLTLQINEENRAKIEELTKTHEARLKALNEANVEKNQVLERVYDAKNMVSQSNEANLTKLFNAVVNRLWEQNAGHYQSANSKSENP